MNQEDRELLRAVLKISEENNKMLSRLYSSWKWGRIMRIFYWVLIIGIAFGAFYFLQPYIDRLADVYDAAREQLIPGK